MALEDMFDSLATIHRKDLESDGQGGFKEKTTPTLVESDVPCRISSLSGNDLMLAGQSEALVTHPIYFSKGANIKLGDTLTIAGRTFHVRVPNQAGEHPYTKVLCEEYQIG